MSAYISITLFEQYLKDGCWCSLYAVTRQLWYEHTKERFDNWVERVKQRLGGERNWEIYEKIVQDVKKEPQRSSTAATALSAKQPTRKTRR